MLIFISTLCLQEPPFGLLICTFLIFSSTPCLPLIARRELLPFSNSLYLRTSSRFLLHPIARRIISPPVDSIAGDLLYIPRYSLFYRYILSSFSMRSISPLPCLSFSGLLNPFLLPHQILVSRGRDARNGSIVEHFCLLTPCTVQRGRLSFALSMVT